MLQPLCYSSYVITPFLQPVHYVPYITGRMLQLGCYSLYVTLRMFHSACYNPCITARTLPPVCYNRYVTAPMLHSVCYSPYVTVPVLQLLRYTELSLLCIPVTEDSIDGVCYKYGDYCSNINNTCFVENGAVTCTDKCIVYTREINPLCTDPESSLNNIFKPGTCVIKDGNPVCE